MDAVGKVHWSCTAWQRNNLAFGRMDVNRIGEQVNFDMLQEFCGVTRLALNIQQGLQPAVCALLQVVQGDVVFFVQPMRGHAFFGHVVHFAGAELELDGGAVGANQGGVQGLVAIHFRDGNVVLEFARYGAIQLVQGAQRQIALGQGVHNDAKAVNIQHVREGLLLLDHLAENAVERLFAAGDFSINPGSRQGDLDGFGDLAQHFTAVATSRQQGLVQYLVAIGVDGLEAAVLKLTEQGVQTQAMCNRRVNIQGFLGHAAALFRLDGVQRAHIVQAVSQLDQDDAHVTRHGQQHLAKAVGLLLRLGGKFQALQLGQTIHNLGHIGTEFFSQFLLGDVLIFDHVMQQGRHQGIGIQLPARTDFRDGNGVRDIGFATGAKLPQVGLIGETIGLPYPFYIFRVQVLRDDLGERSQRGNRWVGTFLSGLCQRRDVLFLRLATT